MKPESVSVKFRTVSITIFPWSPRPGRQYWKFRHGPKQIVRASLEDAKAEARRIAEETFLGTGKLGLLSPAQVRGIRRILEADPQLSLVEDFLSYQRKARPQKPVEEARREFLALKTAAAGNSRLNVTTLTHHLSALPSGILSEITPGTLQSLLHGTPRTRANRRAAWITFFRWCVRMDYLPHGEPTAAEKLERPIVTRSVPATYTPAELAILLSHVRPAYLPWLVLAAFAGIRTEEICPQSGSLKRPLDWSDFQWDRGIIILPPATSKTGRRRVIPILPAVLAWLQDRPESGRIGPHTHPAEASTHGAPGETARLGAFIGGWKRNALRHSFISYRAAMPGIGLAQTAMESGNSETEAARSYNDAKGADEAAEWFATYPADGQVLPQEYPSKVVIQFPPVTQNTPFLERGGT